MTIKRILIKTKTKTKTMTSPIEISTRRGWFQIFSEIHLFVPTTWNWIACKMERKVSVNQVWLNLKKIFSVCNSYISFIIQGISIQYKSPRVFSKPTQKPSQVVPREIRRAPLFPQLAGVLDQVRGLGLVQRQELLQVRKVIFVRLENQDQEQESEVGFCFNAISPI